MAEGWSTVHGQGKATRNANRTGGSYRGASSRLEPGYYRGDDRRARPYEDRSNGYRPYYHQGQRSNWNYQSHWRGGQYRPQQHQDQSNWRARVQGPYRDQAYVERPRVEDHPRQPIQTQPPATELQQVMTMMKAMQASIAALEAKQRGQEVPQAPAQPRTEGPARPEGAPLETRRPEATRPCQPNQVGSKNSLPNINSKPRPSRDQATLDEADKSTNPDFSDLCKAMFRLVQLEHHLGNWRALPKGVDRALQRVMRNIKPPMPNPGLADRLLALTLEFEDKISRAVHDHISDQLCRVKVESETLDTSDAPRARDLVERQLKKKLGNRLSDERREELLTEALKVIRLPRPTVEEGNTAPTPPPVEAGNKETIQVPSSPRSHVEVGETGQRTTALSPYVCLRRLTYATVANPEPTVTPSASKKRRVTSPSQGSVPPPSDTVMDFTAIASDEDEPILGSQRPGPRSSKPTINNVHRKFDADNYTINFKAACRVLVLGDSELKNLKGLPRDFQVESFSGARLGHPWLTEVLRKNTLPGSVQEIVLAAGINDRDSDFTKQTLPGLKECLDELRKTGRKLHFLAVNIPRHFHEESVNNLENLNDYMRAVPGMGFIENLPYSSVKTVSDLLHYDEITLGLIADQVKDHFLN
jgi:hypothetical protein